MSRYFGLFDRAVRSILPTAGLLVFGGCMHAAAINIPVNCGGNQVGVITVQNNAASISGSFSTVPNPPNAGTLAAAAVACGEDHFNWYQVVTMDNQPLPLNFAGQQSRPRHRMERAL
jgi:hypothetical protein